MPSTQNESRLQIDDLLPAVGATGRYQTIVIAICCFLILENGMFFLTSGYNYAVAPYSQCPTPHQGVSLCTQYACSLPLNQRQQYLNPEIAQLKTLGNQFGNYHCGKEYQISLAMGLLWVGAILGSSVFSILADNYGRRVTILVAELLGVIGLIITLLAPSLLVANIGMFIAGGALMSSFVIALCIVREILETDTIEIVTVFTQMFYPLGAAIVIGLYAVFKDWHEIFIWVLLVHQVVSMIFTIIYCKETPPFLIKLKSAEQTIKVLEFMASQNGKRQDFLKNKKITIENIEDLKKRHDAELAHEQIFTHVTLWSYPSLRLKTVCIFIIGFCIACFYFAPFLLVNQFGFNFYVNGILLSVSDLVTYPLIFWFVVKFQRKKIFGVVAIVVFVTSFALIFLMQDKICTSNCWNVGLVVELVLFFALVFSGAVLISIHFIYIYELFPVQLTALGMGICQNATCLVNILMPSILLLFNSINFPVMVFFCLSAILLMGAVFPLPETLGTEPPKLAEQVNPFEGDGDM